MLKEFVESIAGLAVKADTVEIVKPPAEPNHRYAIRQPNGELSWYTAEPPPRNHTALDLSAVIAFANRFHTPDFPCAAWYSRQMVKCVINDDERRDAVTLNLSPSKPMSKLMEFDSRATPIPQSETVLMLRTVFFGCTDPAFIGVIRRLKFRTNESGAGVVEHGRASMGRSLESEVTGEGNIPEYVIFRVPIFESGFSAATTVECALEPIPGTASFKFIPLPGEIERAFAFAEGELKTVLENALAEKEVPVLYGKM